MATCLDLPEVGEVPHVPTWASYLSKTPVWQVQSCQSHCSRIIVQWNILNCFFMCVSVSNLHFPQMNLASEKPPEAVLEGVIFLGDHAPRPPTLWRVLHTIRHPLWKFGQTGFLLLPTAVHKYACVYLYGCLQQIFLWTQLNGTNTTYLDVCPLLEPSPSTPSGDYVQPVDVARDIELRTRNLPAPVSFNFSG